MLTSFARRVRSTLRARPGRWRSVLPFVGVWVAATVAVAANPEPPTARPTATGIPFSRLFHMMPVADSAYGMRAIIVAQRRDCDGNLGIAGVLSRTAIARAVPLRAVLIEGMASDTIQLRSRLPKGLRSATMSLLQHDERRALQAMGHYATPLLLLFDERGRLRLSAPVSSDPVHVVAIRRAIAHLATNDPLP